MRLSDGPGVARLLLILTVSAALVVAPAAIAAFSGPSTTLDSWHPAEPENRTCRATDATCLAERSAVHAQALLDRARALPTGLPGLAAWLGLAGELQGLTSGSVESSTGHEATELLQRIHTRAGTPLSDDGLTQVRGEVADLTGDQRHALVDVLDAFWRVSQATEEIALSEAAQAWIEDPASVPLRSLTLNASEREGLKKLLTASRHLAIQLGDHLPALDQVDLDLPLVVVGARGDTTHDQARVLVIDQSGDDRYTRPAGVGLAGLGVGVVIDRGSGADTYTMEREGQGYGAAGLGLLFDAGGPDRYSLGSFGQGAGIAGLGVLYDAGTADDVFWSPPGTEGSIVGTKGTGLAGIGLLVDEGGNDTLRQDQNDGLVYGAAGGLGLVANRGNGSDAYVSGPHNHTNVALGQQNTTGPVQVAAEVGGLAVLLEEGGDDTYTCGPRIRQGCQGSAGSGGTALLADQDGDDRYVLEGPSVSPLVITVGERSMPTFSMGQGSADGTPLPPGPGVGVLYDGGGDDLYRAPRWAQGYSAGGLGVLYDDGEGEDTYDAPAPLVGVRADGARWVDGFGPGVGLDDGGP